MSLRYAKSPVFRSVCARYTSTAAAPTKRPLKPLLGRFDYLPEELFRINQSKNVVLRAYEEQMKLGRTSYDLHLHDDGLVHPKPGDLFEGSFFPQVTVFNSERAIKKKVQTACPFALTVHFFKSSFVGSRAVILSYIGYRKVFPFLSAIFNFKPCAIQV
jgi:hypothetical protein